LSYFLSTGVPTMFTRAQNDSELLNLLGQLVAISEIVVVFHFSVLCEGIGPTVV
jgi:hypothetical protein